MEIRKKKGGISCKVVKKGGGENSGYWVCADDVATFHLLMLSCFLAYL